jgi:hypothetical protein
VTNAEQPRVFSLRSCAATLNNLDLTLSILKNLETLLLKASPKQA